MPRLLPVPSAWWETPAVTTRALSARPEEARTARQFVRELLTCWGLEALADDAEMIVDELVVNAVLHGTRGVQARNHQGPAMTVLRLCMLRRVGEVMLAVVDPGNETPVPRQPGLGRGERAGPADRRRAQPRMGMEPDRRARQGGMGRTARSLTA